MIRHSITGKYSICAHCALELQLFLIAIKEKCFNNINQEMYCRVFSCKLVSKGSSYF